MRPEVLAFARRMEIVLRRHDAEKGRSWKKMRPVDLLSRLRAEFMELTAAVDSGDAGRILGEAIDTANFAMMLADVVGGLPVQKPPYETTDLFEVLSHGMLGNEWYDRAYIYRLHPEGVSVAGRIFQCREPINGSSWVDTFHPGAAPWRVLQALEPTHIPLGLYGDPGTEVLEPRLSLEEKRAIVEEQAGILRRSPSITTLEEVFRELRRKLP